MLDDRIACVAPAGGVQLCPCEPQLVDHADEGTGSHRWPDAEDSNADHLAFGLGDDDRRGGNIEEVAQEVGVPVPVYLIVAVGRDESNGGVEIGRSGVADVNLHETPSGVYGRAIAAGCCWTTRRKDTTPAPMNPS
jgi:hypothetical protein